MKHSTLRGTFTLDTHNGFINRRLKGTPLVWERVSYEFEEWDAVLPSNILEMATHDWDAEIEALLEEVR